jgi:hypothetical protein
MQKIAIRLVCGKSSRAHTQPLFKKTEVLPIHDLFLYFKSQFMFYYINQKTPNIFDGTWPKRNRDARLRRNPEEEENHIPFYRLTSVERLPYIAIPSSWRNTPAIVKSSHNIIQFNERMKLYLLQRLNEIPVCNRVLCPECVRL